ncbi:MAG TPA: hypothetical protein VG603_16730 [Chitinophagales bacterium]|nr:hypothetical protein [Chitinophagales bacterium]
MAFMLLLVGCSYLLHRMCDERGISPWRYLAGFVGGFFLILFGTSLAIVIVYGQNILKDPDMQRKIMMFTPVALGLHFLLFLFVRRKIERIPVYGREEDDDSHLPPPPPPPSEKKDLSYFR